MYNKRTPWTKLRHARLSLTWKTRHLFSCQCLTGSWSSSHLWSLGSLGKKWHGPPTQLGSLGQLSRLCQLCPNGIGVHHGLKTFKLVWQCSKYKSVWFHILNLKPFKKCKWASVTYCYLWSLFWTFLKTTSESALHTALKCSKNIGTKKTRLVLVLLLSTGSILP